MWTDCDRACKPGIRYEKSSKKHAYAYIWATHSKSGSRDHRGFLQKIFVNCRLIACKIANWREVAESLKTAFSFGRLRDSLKPRIWGNKAMNQSRQVPPNASVAEKIDSDRLHAPSAERNMQALCDVVVRFAPKRGNAIEIASGTGQHVAHWAPLLPGLIWQPSDVDEQRRASIDAWATDAPNILPATHLDATKVGWANQHAAQTLIVLVNLLHLISTPEARTLISEVGQALTPNGRFVLYGPFLRNGIAISDGDASFDASLRASDPAIGYKDLDDIRHWLADAGLTLIATVDMPANNLTLISERPAETP